MHRLLSKLRPASHESRRDPAPRRRGATVVHDAPPPRPRRSLNEAAHKLHH